MTETIESTTAAPQSGAGDAPKKRGGGLNSMLIADLKSMAAGMGIPGAGAMKKAQLIAAIKSAQGGAKPAAAKDSKPAAAPESKPDARRESQSEARKESQPEPRQEGDLRDLVDR